MNTENNQISHPRQIAEEIPAHTGLIFRGELVDETWTPRQLLGLISALLQYGQRMQANANAMADLDRAKN